MQSIYKLYFAGLVLVLAAALSLPVQAKVVGNKIILGSAISFTGKYSSNGIHASNGYNLGVKRVNEMGGVKVGGKTYMLPDLFLVMATQNPIEQEGTYPLPEAQLDRFLLHVFIDYPSVENELKIMRLVHKEALNRNHSENEKNTVVSNVPDENYDVQKILAKDIFNARNEVLKIYMAEEIERYLVEIIAATRTPERYSDELARLITWGASPRGSLALDRCSRARAWLRERDFVTPEDIQEIAADVLRHRIIESYEAESDGLTPDDVINKILAKIPVP